MESMAITSYAVTRSLCTTFGKILNIWISAVANTFNSLNINWLMFYCWIIRQSFNQFGVPIEHNKCLCVYISLHSWPHPKSLLTLVKKQLCFSIFWVTLIKGVVHNYGVRLLIFELNSRSYPWSCQIVWNCLCLPFTVSGLCIVLD